MSYRRVVITGLGVVSPLGSGKDRFWKALTGGKTGYRRVRSFDPSPYRTTVGGEVRDVSPRSIPSFAVRAAQDALSDAGIDAASLDAARSGAVMGTTSGDCLVLQAEVELYLQERSHETFMRRCLPFFPGSAAAAVSRALGLRGPCVTVTSACAAGNMALALAFERVAAGRADIMLAGGVDLFSPMTFAGFNRLLAVAPKLCEPFSPERKGLIPSEGAAVLVLEDEQSARKAGRRAYAEFLGYGCSSDAYHVTMPTVEGVARSLSECLQAAGLAPERIDYVSAHGTGTPANDKTETLALKKVLGPRAAKVPVSSIKSMLGHMMGAASAVEAAACCLSLSTGVLPPTAPHAPGDPDCDLDYVPNEARRADPAIVLSNSFAFGGTNAIIALAKPGAARAPERDPEPLAVTGLGLVDEEDPEALAEALLPDTDLRWIDKPIAYALCAVKRALDDAAVAPGAYPDEAGIVLDSFGEIDTQAKFLTDLLTGGPGAVEPRLFPNTLVSAGGSRAAIVFGLKLLNLSLAGSFPGGESSVVVAADHLARRGRGLLLAGGLDQGAGMLVLEPLAQARRRGARVRALLRSWRESFDPGAAPRRDGVARRLVDAVRGMEGGAPLLVHEGRGLWGGTIALEFAKEEP